MNYPDRTIRQGEPDGPIMRAIRARLRALGCDVPATGAYGPSLVPVIRNFQTRNVDHRGRNLVADARIGPLTWTALFAEPVSAVSRASGGLLQEALVVARSQLGVLETPKNSNRGRDVEKYLAAVGLGGGYAWCAAFTYWCLSEASQATGDPHHCLKSGGVLRQWRHAKDRRLETLSATAAKNDPSRVRPGMVFVMDHGGGLGHTGFILRVRGAWFDTIEGNTDASRTREGGGVYELSRKVGEINAGYVAYG